MERIVVRGDKTYRFTLVKPDPNCEKIRIDPELKRELDKIFQTNEGLFDYSRYNPHLLPEDHPLSRIYARLDDYHDQHICYAERVMRERLQTMSDEEFASILNRYYWVDRADINWILHDLLVEEEVLTDMPVYTIESGGEVVGLATTPAIPVFANEEAARAYLEYLRAHTKWKDAVVTQKYSLDEMLHIVQGRVDLLLWEKVVLDAKKNIDMKSSKVLKFEVDK